MQNHSAYTSPLVLPIEVLVLNLVFILKFLFCNYIRTTAVANVSILYLIINYVCILIYITY